MRGVQNMQDESDTCEGVVRQPDLFGKKTCVDRPTIWREQTRQRWDLSSATLQSHTHTHTHTHTHNTKIVVTRLKLRDFQTGRRNLSNKFASIHPIKNENRSRVFPDEKWRFSKHHVLSEHQRKTIKPIWPNTININTTITSQMYRSTHAQFSSS